MKICEMDTQGKNNRHTVFESTGTVASCVLGTHVRVYLHR